MSYIANQLKETNNNIESDNLFLKKCKDKQIELLKCNSGACEDSVKSIISSNVLDLITDDELFNKEYKIIDKIYEKVNKAVLLVRFRNGNRFILKLRSSFIDNSELKIYRYLRDHHCKYFINLVDYQSREGYYYLLLDYFEGINLSFWLVKNKRSNSERALKYIFKQIVLAVRFLHDSNIIHCDLKLDNIMIDKDMRIKIIDFDLSKMSCSEIVSENIFGTTNYIAPESYDLCIYSKKSDVWGLGIILYNLVTKKFPYETQSINSHTNMYKRNEFKHPNIQEAHNSARRLNYSPKVVDLIKSMLKFKDDKRVDVNEILDSDWLKE